jgi:hypothetical protein
MLTIDVIAPATRTIPRALAVVAIAVLAPPVVTRLHGGTDLQGALIAASVFAGAGLGYAVDDHAARTVASSPTPLVVRRGIRALVCVSVLTAAWLAAFVVASTSPLPVATIGSMLPYASASAGVALGIASFVAPDAPAPPGLVAAFSSLLAIVVVDALSLRFDVLPSLRGADADQWYGIAAVALLAALYGARDPAASVVPRLGRRYRRRDG